MLPFFSSFDCCSDEKDFVLITEWHGEKRMDVIIKRSVDPIKKRRPRRIDLCRQLLSRAQSSSNTHTERTLTSSTCRIYCPTTTLFISQSSKTLYVHVHLKRKCPYTIGQDDLKKRYVQGQRSLLSSDAINIGSYHMHTDSRRKKEERNSIEMACSLLDEESKKESDKDRVFSCIWEMGLQIQ